MKLTRTANAGIYVETEGRSLLLDGVCDPLMPYLGTPGEIRQRLADPYPDIVAFTHRHSDHFEETYARSYTQRTLRSIIGPESFPMEGGCLQFGTIRLWGVPSRHIGRAGADTPHVSYIVEGEKCLWFLGDASPLQWRGRAELPRPDVLVIPYAYAATETGWQLVRELGAEKIVLVHMPEKGNDPYNLWAQVRNTTRGCDTLWIPEIGECLEL